MESEREHDHDDEQTTLPTAALQPTQEPPLAEVADDGEVPEKQIQRWKDEGGAYIIPPE
ncbi:hypothetical protein [Mycobacterium asiaticum]|uniref:hypothetical protein n=1 Tax=Mycobacterium asiaticum TaxID=1790 RepID=UPI000A742C15|nr:hypothetical protein [Mycobacterium asiaticum]